MGASIGSGCIRPGIPFVTAEKIEKGLLQKRGPLPWRGYIVANPGGPSANSQALGNPGTGSTLTMMQFVHPGTDVMLARLLALFLITPVVELALLIQLGDLIGFLPTVAIILATGLAGSYLARREGLSVWRRFNDRLQRGELPGRELIDGMLILVAGALLITPGVLTDVVGFLGLIPLSRHYLRRYINKRLQRAMERGSVRMTFGGFRTYDGGAYRPEPHSRAPDDAQGDASDAWGGRRTDAPRYREE